MPESMLGRVGDVSYGVVAANPRQPARACGTNAS